MGPLLRHVVRRAEPAPPRAREGAQVKYRITVTETKRHILEGVLPPGEIGPFLGERMEDIIRTGIVAPEQESYDFIDERLSAKAEIDVSPDADECWVEVEIE